MGDDVSKSDVSGKPSQYKFTSIRSPDYRLEFINGALSNVTPRGEIICNLHFESRDMPTEQVAIPDGSGSANLSPFQDPGTYTRDVKFGIIINVSVAKDLARLLNDKVKEIEEADAKRSNQGDKHECSI